MRSFTLIALVALLTGSCGSSGNCPSGTVYTCFAGTFGSGCWCALDCTSSQSCSFDQRCTKFSNGSFAYCIPQCSPTAAAGSTPSTCSSSGGGEVQCGSGCCDSGGACVDGACFRLNMQQSSLSSTLVSCGKGPDGNTYACSDGLTCVPGSQTKLGAVPFLCCLDNGTCLNPCFGA